MTFCYLRVNHTLYSTEKTQVYDIFSEQTSFCKPLILKTKKNVGKKDVYISVSPSFVALTFQCYNKSIAQNEVSVFVSTSCPAEKVTMKTSSNDRRQRQQQQLLKYRQTRKKVCLKTFKNINVK